MSKFEELCKIQDMLHANGMEMSEKQLKALYEAEEEFVQTELRQTAEPVMTKARSDMQIVINYTDGTIDSIKVNRYTPDKSDITTKTAPTEVVEAEKSGESQTSEKEKVGRKKRRQSVGFTVAFPDGTEIHEPQAVDTFIKVLQKIGLERIASDAGVPQHVGYSVVSEYERKADKPVQKLVDGYYIYTNLGNDVKIEDLQDLSKRYNLGLVITLDADPESGQPQVVADKNVPNIDWESTRYNLPIREQFWNFLHQTKAEGTANSYVSTLDNAVRKWVNQEVDERADSVYAYTTAEDVRLCIDMLNASPDYVAENARKHNSMSAALNQYLKFVEELEERFKE